jgi:hypothetical protein
MLGHRTDALSIVSLLLVAGLWTPRAWPTLPGLAAAAWSWILTVAATRLRAGMAVRCSC